ncbi:hypothetical protein F4604DRAFT_802729 [Suillus subluteus]|nr:hypothetical protein F4604DRAFT_802729 [Suillus subluteus]
MTVFTTKSASFELGVPRNIPIPYFKSLAWGCLTRRVGSGFPGGNLVLSVCLFEVRRITSHTLLFTITSLVQGRRVLPYAHPVFLLSLCYWTSVLVLACVGLIRKSLGAGSRVRAFIIDVGIGGLLLLVLELRLQGVGGH